MTQVLRYRTICSECGGRLRVGASAHRFLKKYRCLSCGPWPTDGFTVTRLPDAVAEGAVDSSQARLKAKAGRGHALKTGVPMTPSGPGRNRRTKKQRAALKKLNGR